VPVGQRHHAGHANDELVRHVLVEQVAHRVHEHAAARRPQERVAEFLGHETQVEALLVGVALHTAEAFRERRGVTDFAAGADLRATADGVPRRVGPFDFGAVAHGPPA
jgi:hypothetical protein